LMVHRGLSVDHLNWNDVPPNFSLAFCLRYVAVLNVILLQNVRMVFLISSS
jgi:hypothetical protein